MKIKLLSLIALLSFATVQSAAQTNQQQKPVKKGVIRRASDYVTQTRIKTLLKASTLGGGTVGLLLGLATYSFLSVGNELSKQNKFSTMPPLDRAVIATTCGIWMGIAATLKIAINLSLIKMANYAGRRVADIPESEDYAATADAI